MSLAGPINHVLIDHANHDITHDQRFCTDESICGKKDALKWIDFDRGFPLTSVSLTTSFITYRMGTVKMSMKCSEECPPIQFVITRIITCCVLKKRKAGVVWEHSWWLFLWHCLVKIAQAAQRAMRGLSARGMTVGEAPSESQAHVSAMRKSKRFLCLSAGLVLNKRLLHSLAQRIVCLHL